MYDETFDAILDILELILEMQEDGEDIPDDIFDELEAFISEIEGEEVPKETHVSEPATQNAPQPSQTPINEGFPRGAELIWILAGERPDAFISYLRTIPDPELNSLGENPQQLKSVIQRLKSRITPAAGESAEGIPRAQLQSSNVYGFQYDPGSGTLKIKFQGNDGVGNGPVYRYRGVPPHIFKIMQAGAVPAKTSGNNKWGAWWKFKQPSLGAAVNALIVRGGFPYQRIS